MMTEEPHYRDSVKKLNSKISEISESELKGKDTIKREILCYILHIPISNKTTTEYQIHEVLAPICLKNKLTFSDVKHKMLCDYFGIPVYYKPKKKSYIEYRTLKLLMEVSSKELYTSEIAKAFGENLKYISNLLRYYCGHHNSWFRKVLVKQGKRTVCKWTVTPIGIEAYKSGEAKFLRKRLHVSSLNQNLLEK